MKTQISYVGHAIACLFTFFKRLACNRVPYVVLALVPLCYAADWQPYQPALLEKAKAAGQPVLMDFTAEWCAPCKEMDKKVFPDLRLVEALKSFALLRVDMTDTDSPTVEALARKFNVESLPTIIFYDATGKQTVHETGFQEVEKMVQYAQTTLQTASPLASNSLSKPVVDNRKAHFSVTAAPTEVRRGESITLTFTATIEKDWHLYALKWTDKIERLETSGCPDSVGLSSRLRPQFQNGRATV
jgi:thiol-disulfide isomerase/thioredoxin